MDWQLIQSLFDGKGLIFWAAVTAVTLGLTMLSVSIYFQMRKVLLSKQPKIALRGRFGRQKAEKETAEKHITVNDDAYQVDHYLAKGGPVAANDQPADPLLNNLLARLRSSAERLDRVHASLASDAVSNSQSDSRLKASGEEVDYVYRTGRA